MSDKKSQKPDLLQRLQHKINHLSSVYLLLFLFAVFILGIIFWGAFNTAMEETNNMDFCITCHEMKENVYQEYRHTIHYSNRTGVRATCPDCHVPREWKHKLLRKIQATNELMHKVLGSIDTPEKWAIFARPARQKPVHKILKII